MSCENPFANSDANTHHPFTFGKNGKTIQLKSAKQTLRKVTSNLVNLIKKHDSVEKRVLILSSLLGHKDLKEEVELLGVNSRKNDNINRFLCKLYQKDNKRGQIEDVKRKAMEIVVASCISTPSKNSSTGELEVNDMDKNVLMKMNTMSRTSGNLLFEKAKSVRHDVIVHNDATALSKRKRHRATKMSESSQKALFRWIENHPLVKDSPSKDVLEKVVGWDVEKKKIARKIRLCSITELHNDMLKSKANGGFEYSRDKDNNVLMSDTCLRNFIKLRMPHLKKATKRDKQMCGCATCIIIKSQHSSLVFWRKNRLKQFRQEIQKIKEEIMQLRPSRSSNTKRKELEEKKEMLMGNYFDYYKYVFCNRHPEDKIVESNDQQSVSITSPTENSPVSVASPTENKVRVPNVEDALNQMMCPTIKVNDQDFRHIGCSLRVCKDCPTPSFHQVETSENSENNLITFQSYEKTTTCSRHGVLATLATECEQCNILHQKKINYQCGKIRTRKKLTKLTRSMKVFLSDYYNISLTAYAYHKPFVHYLSNKNVGETRYKVAEKARDNNKLCVIMDHDYAEAWKMEKENEAQSEHFGFSANVSIEGYYVAHFDEEAITAEEKQKFKKEFHSYMGDRVKQDAASSYVNMNNLIEEKKEMMKKCHVVRDEIVIVDRTDGCQDQYRKATAMKLLCTLAMRYRCVIDRSIKAPGHGKDLVDGLNAVDKNFIAVKLQSTQGCDEATNDRKMRPEAMIEGKEHSQAAECVRLLSDDSRKDGVVSDIKNRKRELRKKIDKRHYHLVCEKDIKVSNLKYKITSTFQKTSPTKYGIRAMYNIRADYELGENTIALRRVPCYCTHCTDTMLAKWDHNISDPKKQDRYKPTKNCVLWPVLGEFNDWQIMSLGALELNDEEEEEEMRMDVIVSIAEQMASQVTIGGVGIMNVDDGPNFNFVKWMETPYKSESDYAQIMHNEDKDDDFFHVPSAIKRGDLVCECVYMYEHPSIPGVYYESDDIAVVRMQNIVVANADSSDYSFSALGNNKRKATDPSMQKNMVRISPYELKKAEHRLMIMNNIDIEEEIYYSEDDTDAECDPISDDELSE